ncbi:MAG: methylated-DNA--[protein]-cysteine S-methyltransferase [bacterium]|nr:methylated-DNA--[protein]-cysteine S-methyltransferase [bacterium]
MADHTNGRVTEGSGIEGNGTRPAGDEAVWVWETESPIGRLGLARTEVGLRRLCFIPSGAAGAADSSVKWLASVVAETVSPAVTVAAAPLDDVRRELDDYFAGRLQEFTIPIDWRGSIGFYRRALEVTAAIPYGETRSYAAVAAGAGSPRAARAVGTAMATNPIALIVPCHRVVRGDGSRGFYGGGAGAKDLLLDMEGSVSGC